MQRIRDFLVIVGYTSLHFTFTFTRTMYFCLLVRLCEHYKSEDRCYWQRCVRNISMQAKRPAKDNISIRIRTTNNSICTVSCQKQASFSVSFHVYC